jgi:hypothetical protein
MRWVSSGFQSEHGVPAVNGNGVMRTGLGIRCVGCWNGYVAGL